MLRRILNYFERDALIHIQHLHYTEGEKLKRKNDSFSITICQYGKCHSHFGKIPWEDASQVLEALKSSKGRLLLSVQVGMGESKIMIPKWAKKKLVEEIEKELEENPFVPD